MARKKDSTGQSPEQTAKSKQDQRQRGHDSYHAHDHGGEERTNAEKDKQVMSEQKSAPPTTGLATETDGHTHAHAETGLERGEQKVKIEDAGPARKKITIEVPADRISKKIKESFGKLRDDAALPGFRRGRAPQRLLEKRFGDGVRDEVKSQLLSECYTQAIEDEKLDVIGEPEVKELASLKLPDSGDFVFSLEVEISPKVELPGLEGIEVSKTKIDVSDENVTTEIEAYRERQGKLVAVPDAAVSANDWVVGDVRVLAGENADPASASTETLAQQPGAYIVARGEDKGFKGQVLGILVDDLGKRLIGKKPGETVTVSMTGPAGHENEKVRAKPITIVIRIEKVERLEPAPLQTLIEQAGVDSEAALRDRVRKMLEERRDRDERSALHEQICKHLLEKVNLDLPVGLTGRQTERVLYRRAMEMAYRGAKDEEIRQVVAEMRTSSEEDARRQLKLFFILDQAAKQFEVDVTDNEVNSRINMLAIQQGRRPEKVRQQMGRSGEIEHLYLQIREQKTLDKILEKAKVS